jgi:23S rRNA maturation mini-RNase III
MKIAVKECTDEELPEAEQKWQERGYKRVDKTDPKSLEPMEYMKSFSNKANWVLARRDPD